MVWKSLVWFLRSAHGAEKQNRFTTSIKRRHPLTECSRTASSATPQAQGAGSKRTKKRTGAAKTNDQPPVRKDTHKRTLRDKQFSGQSKKEPLSGQVSALNVERRTGRSRPTTKTTQSRSMSSGCASSATPKSTTYLTSEFASVTTRTPTVAPAPAQIHRVRWRRSALWLSWFRSLRSSSFSRVRLPIRAFEILDNSS